MYDQREYDDFTITDYRDVDEIIAEVSKPGDVHVGVHGANDVMQVRAVKSDLLAKLNGIEGADHGWSLSVIKFDNDPDNPRRVVGYAH